MNHIEKQVREELRKQFENDLRKQYREKLYKEVRAEVYAEYGEENPQVRMEEYKKHLKEVNENYWKKAYWIKDIKNIFK